MKFTLEKAFLSILNERGLLTSLGYSKFQVQNMKRNFGEDKVSTDLMRKVVKDSKKFKLLQQELYVKK